MASRKFFLFFRVETREGQNFSMISMTCQTHLTHYHGNTWLTNTLVECIGWYYLGNSWLTISLQTV